MTRHRPDLASSYVLRCSDRVVTAEVVEFIRVSILRHPARGRRTIAATLSRMGMAPRGWTLESSGGPEPVAAPARAGKNYAPGAAACPRAAPAGTCRGRLAGGRNRSELPLPRRHRPSRPVRGTSSVATTDDPVSPLGVSKCRRGSHSLGRYCQRALGSRAGVGRRRLQILRISKRSISAITRRQQQPKLRRFLALRCRVSCNPMKE